MRSGEGKSNLRDVLDKVLQGKARRTNAEAGRAWSCRSRKREVERLASPSRNPPRVSRKSEGDGSALSSFQRVDQDFWPDHQVFISIFAVLDYCSAIDCVLTLRDSVNRGTTHAVRTHAIWNWSDHSDQVAEIERRLVDGKCAVRCVGLVRYFVQLVIDFVFRTSEWIPPDLEILDVLTGGQPRSGRVD